MTGCTTPESPLTVWATSWLYALGCSGAEEDEGFDDADDALDDPSSPASLRRALASIDFVDASKLARLEKMGVRGSKDLLWLSEADVASLRLRTIEARKLMWLCDRMRAEMAESPASGARAAVTQVVLPPPQWEHTDAEGKKTLAQRAQEQQHRRGAPVGGEGAPTLAEAKAAMGEQWSLLTVEEQAAILCNKVIPVQFVAPGEAAKHASTPSKVAGGGKENAAPPDARTYDEMMRAVPPSVPTGKRYSTTKSTRAVRAQNASKSDISTADAAADERNGLSTL